MDVEKMVNNSNKSSYFIVHLIVEGVELVRPVEGDASEASLLGDSYRRVGGAGGGGGLGQQGGGDGEGAEHCSAVRDNRVLSDQAGAQNTLGRRLLFQMLNISLIIKLFVI